MLFKDAQDIPKRLRSFKAFKMLFSDKRNYEYHCHGYKLLINVSYAYEHFEKNTYMEHRSPLNGTLHDIIHDPLLVVIDGKKEVLTFYKPYKNSEGLFHMLMYQATRGTDNVYRFKTIYKSDSIIKVEKIIKTPDNNTIYFKYE
jgi:hypothetical protein